MVKKEIGWMIGRPINGITLNPLEWILDENNEAMLFDTKDDAIDFLKVNGITDDEIEDLLFYVQVNCPGCKEIFELSEDDFKHYLLKRLDKQPVFICEKCAANIKVPVKKESEDAKMREYPKLLFRTGITAPAVSPACEISFYQLIKTGVGVVVEEPVRNYVSYNGAFIAMAEEMIKELQSYVDDHPAELGQDEDNEAIQSDICKIKNQMAMLAFGSTIKESFCIGVNDNEERSETFVRYLITGDVARVGRKYQDSYYEDMTIWRIVKLTLKVKEGGRYDVLCCSGN